MMSPEELMKPPTELEAAELLAAATRPDHQLNEAGVNVLRRLLFDWDRLKARRPPPPATGGPATAAPA